MESFQRHSANGHENLQRCGAGIRKKTLAVVIVAYEEVSLLAKTISSVLEATDEIEAEVVVVDNSDRTNRVEKALHAYIDQIVYLKRPDNPGFGTATNYGFKHTNSNYLLVLNPDSQIDSKLIVTLMAVLHAEPAVGAIGPRLVTPAGEFDHAAKRGFPTLLAAAQYFFGRAIRKPQIWSRSRYVAPDVEECSIGEVDSLNGAFLLLKSSAFIEVGGFDERYWMYAEDIDLCVRLRTHGWRVVYWGAQSAIHVRGGTSKESGRRSANLRGHFIGSMAQFVEIHKDRYPAPKALGCSLRWIADISETCSQRR